MDAMNRRPDATNNQRRNMRGDVVDRSVRRSVAAPASPARGARPFSANRGSPAAHIWRHFHPTTKASTRKMVGVLNNSEASPSNLAYVVLTLGEHPHWHGQDTIYVKSRLELLPEYAEKKAQLVEQHKEPSHEEKMERIIAQMTESINFKRYGIEDGPDVECYDNQGNCKSIIVPGDWMSKAYELPEIAGCVDTPSVKYRPAEAEAIAVYACRKWDEGYFFVAWFVIEEIELFAANSLALAYMAHDKKWITDISCECASVKLRKVKRDDPLWAPPPRLKHARVSEKNAAGRA